MRADLAEALERIDAATAALLGGDPQPFRELLAVEQEVVILGAFGGHEQGVEAVSARLGQTATSYGGGGRVRRQPIASWAGTELAATVDLEHIEWSDPDAGPTSYVYRATHVFAREAGEWKLLLRHADPLASFRGPEFARNQPTDAGSNMK